MRIPKGIREANHIRPGDRFIVISKGGLIHLVPFRTIAETAGIFRGQKVTLKGLRDHHDTE